MMNCEQTQALLDQYMDGTLDENTMRALSAHLAECEECSRLYQMCQDLQSEEGEVPDGFSSSWRQAVRKEEKMEQKSQKKHTLRNIALVAAAFVFVVGGTLITRDRPSLQKRQAENINYAYTTSSSSDQGAVLMKRAAAGAVEEASYDTAVNGMADDQADAQQQKLIRRVDFTVKTMEFDAVLENLQSLTASMAGRVEYVSQYGDRATGALRNASLTLRIPAEKLDAFLESAESVGNITSFTNQVEDVTNSYYDIQTRLNTQLTKMERLQALLAEATEVSDLIEIESSIADTQYMIDSYQGRLKGLDDEVDYSTVSVYVQETRVAETKEASFLERIGAGISDSLEIGVEFLGDLVVFLLSALPWIAAVVVIVVIVKVIRKKKK